MTRHEKMISRMRNNPFGDWQIDTLKAIAARHGIEATHEGSSHVVFRTPDGRQISVPAHRSIKAVYIKAFLELLEDGRMADLSRYPFEVRPLGDQEGGGFLISFPDFPGCMSDGETLEETVNHGMDALKAFVAVMERHGDKIPEPGESAYSGHFVTRVPKNVHARLAQQAKKEGVSMNAMVASILAESLGRSTQEHV